MSWVIVPGDCGRMLWAYTKFEMVKVRTQKKQYTRKTHILLAFLAVSPLCVLLPPLRTIR